MHSSGDSTCAKLHLTLICKLLIILTFSEGSHYATQERALDRYYLVT